MDVYEIRKDFPIFNNIPGPFVYLDNGATAQKPWAVIQRLEQFYTCENANIHRGGYPLSSQASGCYERARETVKNWIGASSAQEIVFTKSDTEAVNLAANAVFDTWIRQGDNVIVTELEHSSNYFPWKRQCEKVGIQLRTALAREDGTLEPEAVLRLMDKNTKLVAITAMSNVTGFCPRLKPIIAEAHRGGAKVLVDAAQAVVHSILQVQDMDCDFLCFSGHKIYGPMGTGVLYGKRQYLEEMAPFLYGGDMVVKGPGGDISYKRTWDKYEAGTQNIAGVLGLEAALKYLESRGFAELLLYERELAAYLRERLEAIKGAHIIGSRQESSVLCFETEQFGAYDIGVLMANAGVAMRCGAHCAYPLLERMKKEALCRISLAFYNTREEIDYMADHLEGICRRGSL